jgi:hypothetical protein
LTINRQCGPIATVIEARGMRMSQPPRRKKTARFVEIAAAGVSVATVDRVLNERGSVSATARAKVVAAARELAVPRLLPDTRHGLIHIDILLPDNHSSSPPASGLASGTAHAGPPGGGASADAGRKG